MFTVTDGDTLEVRTADGIVERVRLIGIDAPENGECLSDEATRALASLVGGSVTLEDDATDRDRFGRWLRYVEADGTFVNAELVGRGLAIAREYPPDTARQAVLEAAQAQAQAAGIGLWDTAACGRATSAELEIVEIVANPSGEDLDDLHREYVVIRNNADVEVDLSRWQVRDESASHRFDFPDGFRLAAGASVTLRTGCGDPTASDLHWCNEASAVWNNQGDTVFLIDPNGNIAVSRSY